MDSWILYITISGGFDEKISWNCRWWRVISMEIRYTSEHFNNLDVSKCLSDENT